MSRPDIVLDPVCGSGTSIVAAHRLGRRWIGIERSPDGIEVCRERLAGADYAETLDGVDWADPPNLLIEGDCLDVLPRIPARTAHLVVMDPPFGPGVDKRNLGIDWRWDADAERHMEWVRRHGELAANGSAVEVAVEAARACHGGPMAAYVVWMARLTMELRRVMR